MHPATSDAPAATPATATPTDAGRRTRALSQGLVDLQERMRDAPLVFDVVIVGSGYGGSVAAQQLAGLQQRDGRPLNVCVLERGSEYLPGMFASRFAELPGHVRWGMQGSGQVGGTPEGLLDVRIGDDVATLVANGLGGGSLVNAGVMLAPAFDQFDSRMPPAVVADLQSTYLQAARSLLLQQPLHSDGPFSATYPLKNQRLAELGQRQTPPLPHQAAHISVALQAVAPHAHSVGLAACNGCGDCMTGCNVGAKASLDTNLLAQAQRGGVHIYTGASVVGLARHDGQWALELVHTAPALRAREARPFRLLAHKVILAAGTLGSTEILLRARSDTLVFSSMLGQRFSCNGDNIAALHRLPDPAHCTADEHQALHQRTVGPTITHMVAVPPQAGEQGFWVQDFSVPAPLQRLFAELVTTAHTVAQLPSPDTTLHGDEPAAGTDPCAVDAHAMEHTLLVGLIGHDSADGALRLPLAAPERNGWGIQEGVLQIVWPQARHGPQLDAAHARLERYCQQAFPGASLVANPLWRLLPPALANLVDQPRGPVLTVHPLGGCPMGEDPVHGVVDPLGRVFNCGRTGITGGPDGDDWQGSLVVLDGAIVPGSLGANPALTISALALRALHGLAQAWAYADKPAQVDTPLQRPRFAPAQPAQTQTPEPTQVEVIERLVGEVVLQADAATPTPWVVELTLHYAPVALRLLMDTWGGRCLAVDPQKSRLRLFRADVWQQKLLRVQGDAAKAPHVVWSAPLAGTLRFLHRERSGPLQRRLRALLAYFFNRGKRDIWQEFVPKIAAYVRPREPKFRPSQDPAAQSAPNIFQNALNLATRAGEVRRFDYALTVQSPGSGSGSGNNSDSDSGSVFSLDGQAAALRGHKRLTYGRRANPWNQLTQLTLTQMPFMPAGHTAVLKLDTRFLAQQGVPLVRVVAQANQADALLDMASFGLFMARLMLTIHLWTFRKPDTPSTRKPQRLPMAIAGLPAPETTELVVAVKNLRTDAVVRLTRYPRHGSTLPPLAMLHGYSVSGTTYTHPSLQPSAAEFFWRQGRDVWVIDLRTSAGMPTATRPWAFEDAALVDIPTALLHIKNTTGQRVDVLAHCIGAAMLGMAILTEAAQVGDDRIQLGVDSWITAVQLGTLAAFNGDGDSDGHQQHPTIRSVVLSQKGPLLRYTEANIFRAYLLQTLRRWFLQDGYQFQASESPKVAEQLMDRLLSSVPYEDGEYDVENPAWPCATTPWTSTRHRMDILYARDFQAKNLRPATLDALDDLFGPIHLDTVAQTLHFVRFNCITNQRGRGEFVTLQSLAQRWRGIPTLAIHGQHNGLVDVSTQDLLQANFEAAGIPFARKTYAGMGHQDVLIGKDSEGVFQDILAFLQHPPGGAPLPPPAAQPPVATPAAPAGLWTLARPWIGPRIHPVAGVLQVYALSTPRFGRAQLVLVPVRGFPGRPQRCGALAYSPIGDSRDWLALALPNVPLDAPEPTCEGWLAVVAYAYSQTTVREGDVAYPFTDPAAPPAPGGRLGRTYVPVDPNPTTLHHHGVLGGPPATGGWATLARVANGYARATATVQQPSADAVDAWLQATDEDLPRCFIALADMRRYQRADKTAFAFTLGSCQFPAGLLDQPVAEQSLQLLEQGMDSCDFAIFAGDQIYADASAGLVDPVRSDERLDLPYERALRAEPLREIMRRGPVHMLLDDHEIHDNWEPHFENAAARYQPGGGLVTGDTSRRFKEAMVAYWKYQRLETHSAKTVASIPVSYTFQHGDAFFYMLDTRTQRALRKPATPEDAVLVDAAEMAMLQAWTRASPGKLKFIVSPSLLLPRRLASCNPGHAGNPGRDAAARGDAWDGYPTPLATLLETLVDSDHADHIVFLSGDEHVSCVVQATLSKPGRPPCKIVSLHASGLYAPFPFANSKAEDFVAGVDHFACGAVACRTDTQFVPPGHMFAQLSVYFDPSFPRLDVRFRGAATDVTHHNLFDF